MRAVVLVALSVLAATTRVSARRDGPEVYRTHCASCHGSDGRGGPARAATYTDNVPDFTDCNFGTPEASADWRAVVTEGGRSRGLSRRMPAFAQVLSGPEIADVVQYLRSFCTSDAWPRGELNLPRPMLTEKAFPESEDAVTVAFSRTSATTTLSYERRIGARWQLELVAPFTMVEQPDGEWKGGIGDVAASLKRVLVASLATGTIASVQLEVAAPTGRVDRGLGAGTMMTEPSVMAAQLLPAQLFVQAQAGVGVAYDRSFPDEAFARLVAGAQLVPIRHGRMFAPMLELQVARELDAGSPTDVDVVPQLQVTLSARQHIRAAAGVQIPVTDRRDRATAGMFYLLWDWADGGFTEGW